MIHSTYRALLLLSFGLISHAFTLGFSDSRQCGSVEVTWAQRADAVERFQYPFYLYILPFNGTATIRQIHNWNASTSSGSALLDFPLSASSPYILGVADSQGRGVGTSSAVLATQNSTNTSCLSSQPQQQPPSQFQATPTAEPSECPSILLSFNPPNNPPRALVFSPGGRPRDIEKTSTAFKTGFIRLSGLTSLSQVVVVYQENDTAPAYTSSLLTVGGTDSVRCEASLSVVPSRPTALEGGSVIGYAFAAIVFTALITTSCLYLYNLRIMAAAMKPPCPPPKDYFLLTQRRSTQRDVDLEAACLIPLPSSTTSLISPSFVLKNRSEASFVIPEPPYTTPVSPRHSISNLNHTEETVHPIVPSQPGQQPNEPASEPVMLSPAHRHNTSPSAYPVVTKQTKRHSDVSTTYLHSTRPSTFTSDTRESGILSFSEAITARFTPRPDSPTLPDIQTTSSFHFEFNNARSSKGSSKKSEKRNLYLKMEDVKEDLEDGAGVSKRRRARSLSRSRGNGSHQGKKKARSVPR